MIWSQDGDPTYCGYSDHPQQWEHYSFHHESRLATVEELWHATAHEAADTVCQILSGDGITYGLSLYRKLWAHSTPVSDPAERKRKACRRAHDAATRLATLQQDLRRLKKTHAAMQRDLADLESGRIERTRHGWMLNLSREDDEAELRDTIWFMASTSIPRCKMRITRARAGLARARRSQLIANDIPSLDEIKRAGRAAELAYVKEQITHGRQRHLVFIDALNAFYDARAEAEAAHEPAVRQHLSDAWRQRLIDQRDQAMNEILAWSSIVTAVEADIRDMRRRLVMSPRGARTRPAAPTR